MSQEVFTMLNAVWPFVIMASIFYFMLWRPQKQEQTKRHNMLNSLKKGDKVVMIGGMLGTITKLGEKKLTLQIAENVEVEYLRNSVQGHQDAAKQEMAEKGAARKHGASKRSATSPASVQAAPCCHARYWRHRGAILAGCQNGCPQRATRGAECAAGFAGGAR